MVAIRIRKVLRKKGEIVLNGLPFKKGQQIELILLADTSKTVKKQLTVDELLNSGIVGLWKNRMDIKDSTSFSRNLREQAQNRKK